ARQSSDAAPAKSRPANQCRSVFPSAAARRLSSQTRSQAAVSPCAAEMAKRSARLQGVGRESASLTLPSKRGCPAAPAFAAPYAVQSDEVIDKILRGRARLGDLRPPAGRNFAPSTVSAISRYAHKAFASCICRGLRHSGSKSRGLPTTITAVFARE